MTKKSAEQSKLDEAAKLQEQQLDEVVAELEPRYYAANGKISTDPVEGGIEISDAQYAEAIDAMMSGKLIVVTEGVLTFLDELPKPPPTVSEKILAAPIDLFGGPTLGEVFNEH